jgi:hypothetical protein
MIILDSLCGLEATDPEVAASFLDPIIFWEAADM